MLPQLPAVPLGFLSCCAIALSERSDCPARVFSAIALQHGSACGKWHRHALLAVAQSCLLRLGWGKIAKNNHV